MGLVIRGVLGSWGVQPKPNDKADGHLTYTMSRDTIFVAGVTYARTAEIQWSNFAQWLNAAGLIFGALAGVAAVASYVKRRRSAGANHALIHGGLLAAALATGFIAALVLARDAFGSIPEALWWSGAAALFALAAAWIGFSDRRLS